MTLSGSILKAWLVGVAVLLVSNGVWFVSLQAHSFSVLLVWLLWISPLIAALVSAYLSPRKKILLGISLAIPAAIFAVALNTIYELLGNAVDFPGLRGGASLFVITLGYSVLLCALGGGVGYYLSRGSRTA